MPGSKRLNADTLCSPISSYTHRPKANKGVVNRGIKELYRLRMLCELDDLNLWSDSNTIVFVRHKETAVFDHNA